MRGLFCVHIFMKMLKITKTNCIYDMQPIWKATVSMINNNYWLELKLNFIYF